MTSGSVLPLVVAELCNGCGVCVNVCPSGALALQGGVVTLAWPARCAYDGECEIACPTGAIEVPYLVVFDGSDA